MAGVECDSVKGGGVFNLREGWWVNDVSVGAHDTVVGEVGNGFDGGCRISVPRGRYLLNFYLDWFYFFPFVMVNVRTFVFFTGMFVLVSKLAFVRPLFDGFIFCGFTIIAFPSRL